MRQFEISVRSLVEFILRSGDITSGYAGGVRANLRALEGTRLHQKLQKAEGGDYAKEVTMLEMEELFNAEGEKVGELLIEGRADGIFTFAGTNIDEELALRKKMEEEQWMEASRTQITLETGEEQEEQQEDDLQLLKRDILYRCIDEIKSTEIDLKYIHPDTHPLHFAQAKCYALFLAKRENLQEVLVRLSYVHVETEKVKHLFRLYTKEELQQFYDDLVDRYKAWMLWQVEWDEIRTQSLNELQFPFASYRKGQRAMAACVYRAIDEKKRIFIQAPTGIGKTMSTLFPALKAMGEGKGEKTFYLTAKNVTGEAAENAVRILREQDMRLKTLRVTAKDRICFLEKRKCSPVDCPYARGHFDRVNDAVLRSLKERDSFTTEEIEKIARENQLCPYELSLDIASWCDLIICDYNYAFDPSASLKRFFAVGARPYTLLVDEAHNLVDRARSMFSADLTRKELSEFKKTLKKEDPSQKNLEKSLGKVIRTLGEIHKALKAQEAETEEQAISGSFAPKGKNWARIRELKAESFAAAGRANLEEAFLNQLSRLSDRMGEYFETLGHKGEEIPEDAWELYFRVLFFQRILGEMDEGYESYAERHGADVKWTLFCVDPSEQLKNVILNLRSVIYFSATLTPIDYYRNLLGTEPEDEAIALTSPFDPARRKTMIAPIPVTYQYREQSLQTVVDLIYLAASSKQGHYLAFFPSYAYMEKVMDVFEEKYPKMHVLRQAAEMTEDERQSFLARFREDKEPLLGAAVLGGVFSEGIDLKGDSLIGTVIVTVGLPQLGLERDLIKEHFDRENGEGFDYSYRFPGIGRVLQAVGRVIRTEEDKGMILLIDRRFGEDRYLDLYPEEWFPVDRVSTENIKTVLEEFWNR